MDVSFKLFFESTENLKQLNREFKEGYTVAGLRKRAYAMLEKIKFDPIFENAWKGVQKVKIRRLQSRSKTLQRVFPDSAADTREQYNRYVEETAKKSPFEFAKASDMYFSVRHYCFNATTRGDNIRLSKEIARIIECNYPEIYETIKQTKIWSFDQKKKFVYDKLLQAGVDDAVAREFLSKGNISWNDYVLDIQPYILEASPEMNEWIEANARDLGIIGKEGTDYSYW